MNATEREFLFFLQQKQAIGEFSSFGYEIITLRWGVDASELSYTPDFAAFRQNGAWNGKPWIQIVFYEIKGAHAWKQDIVRFKAARNHFISFEFQLWEKGDQGWQQTI